MVVSRESRKSTKPSGFRTFFVLKTRIFLLFSFVIFTLCAKSQGTILWKVTNNQTKHESYLLGTLHQIGNSFVDSIPLISDKLEESDIAIFETFDHSMRIREKLNLRSDNYDYKKILKKKETEYIENLFDSLGVPMSKLTPIEALIKMDQIYVETICGAVKINDDWDHFDNYLIDQAIKAKVEIMELENDSIQLRDINLVGEKYNFTDFQKPLKREIKALQKGKVSKQRCQYVWNYMNFNLDYQLNTECSKSSGLIARNEKWLTILTPIISEKKTFVVVGIMHLYGACGLISQLQSMGYKVDPVTL